MKYKKIALIDKGCVACGSCIKVCPKNAIRIAYGTKAEVARDKCVGCSKCSKICPANVIRIVERGENHE